MITMISKLSIWRGAIFSISGAVNSGAFQWGNPFSVVARWPAKLASTGVDVCGQPSNLWA